MFFQSIVFIFYYKILTETSKILFKVVTSDIHQLHQISQQESRVKKIAFAYY